MLKADAGKMGVQSLSEDVILVALPKEPELRRELSRLNDVVCEKGPCDVIIDFSGVEMLTSSSISNLLILRKWLADRGRQLVLCNVRLPTRGVFSVAGLSEVFKFADDRAAALAAIGRARKGEYDR